MIRLRAGTSGVRRRAGVLALLLLAGPLASSRSNLRLVAQQTPAFRAATQAEWLIATAIDPDGRLVTDLTQRDFEIRDRGVVREVTAFRSDPIPFALAVMLDVSGSMITNLPEARRALGALTAEFEPGDRAAIGTFESFASLSPGFSANPDTLAHWVTATIGGAAVLCPTPEPVPDPWRATPAAPVSKRFIQPSSTVNLLQPRVPGNTALWDALVCAVNAVAADAETPRRVVLVITDGIDNQSVMAEEDVEDYANHYGVMVYCIGMFGTDPGGLNADGLKELARSTGGGYFQLKSSDDLVPTFARVADELRHQYVFGISPLASDPDGRGLEIHSVRAGLTVRARHVKLDLPAVQPAGGPEAEPGRPGPSAAPPPPPSAASPSPVEAAASPGKAPPRTPAARAVPAFGSTLDSYEANPRFVTPLPEAQLPALLETLKETAPLWIDADGQTAVPRRRLAAATFVLEVLMTQTDSVEWLKNQPAVQMLEWACSLLRKGPPSPAGLANERLWFLASVGLLERSGGSSPASTDGEHLGFTTMNLSAGRADASVSQMLLYHLADAEARVPDEPRWVLAEAVAMDLRTWPDWRDEVAFSTQPIAQSAITGAYEKALARPEVRQEALVRLGEFDLRLGLTTKALEYFHDAGEPADPYVAYWLHLFEGNAFEKTGRPTDAIAAYRAALARAPFAQSATVALGSLLLTQHRAAEGAVLVNELLSRPPQPDPWTYFTFPDWRFFPSALADLRKASVR